MIKINNFTKLIKIYWKRLTASLLFLVFIVLSVFFSLNKVTSLNNLLLLSQNQKDKNLVELTQIRQELEALKSTDQIKRNDELETKIKNIEDSYKKSISVYEDLLKLKDKKVDTKDLDKFYTQAIVALSE